MPSLSAITSPLARLRLQRAALFAAALMLPTILALSLFAGPFPNLRTLAVSSEPPPRPWDSRAFPTIHAIGGLIRSWIWAPQDKAFEYPDGYWYGPGWWGGSRSPDAPGPCPPVDDLDYVALRHDMGYWIAEEQERIWGPKEKWRIMAMADLLAVEEASALNADPAKWRLPPQQSTLIRTSGTQERYDRAKRYRDRIRDGFPLVSTYNASGLDPADSEKRLVRNGTVETFGIFGEDGRLVGGRFQGTGTHGCLACIEKGQIKVLIDDERFFRAPPDTDDLFRQPILPNLPPQPHHYVVRPCPECAGRYERTRLGKNELRRVISAKVNWWQKRRDHIKTSSLQVSAGSDGDAQTIEVYLFYTGTRPLRVYKAKQGELHWRYEFGVGDMPYRKHFFDAQFKDEEHLTPSYGVPLFLGNEVPPTLTLTKQQKPVRRGEDNRIIVEVSVGEVLYFTTSDPIPVDKLGYSRMTDLSLSTKALFSQIDVSSGFRGVWGPECAARIWAVEFVAASDPCRGKTFHAVVTSPGYGPAGTLSEFGFVLMEAGEMAARASALKGSPLTRQETDDFVADLLRQTLSEPEDRQALARVLPPACYASVEAGHLLVIYHGDYKRYNPDGTVRLHYRFDHGFNRQTLHDSRDAAPVGTNPLTAPLPR